MIIDSFNYCLFNIIKEKYGPRFRLKTANHKFSSNSFLPQAYGWFAALLWCEMAVANYIWTSWWWQFCL